MMDRSKQPVIPNFFLVGCQKTASTWLHRCFQEHPEIYVPDSDSIHFFTINYYKGIEWYKKFYQDYSGQKVVGDTTSSYIRDYDAPERIASFNPDAKILISLRNPIERAFSHFWHEKAKGKIAFEFDEVLQNYDLYQNYIVSGFYSQHIKRYLTFFPEDKIFITLFEELKENPDRFITRIFEFLEVDTNFKPSILNKAVNKASAYPKQFIEDVHYNGYKNKFYNAIKNNLHLGKIYRFIKRRLPENNKKKTETEYLTGVDPYIREQLSSIYREDIINLQLLLKRNLAEWT